MWNFSIVVFVLSIKSFQTDYQISQPELERNDHDMIQMLTPPDHIGKIVIAYRKRGKIRWAKLSRFS